MKKCRKPQVDLQEHLEKILDERQGRITDRFLFLEKAIETAKAEMERRLTGLNELRNEVTADRGLFITREAFELRIKPIEKTATQTEAGSLAWVKAAGLFLLVIGLLLHILKVI